MAEDRSRINIPVEGVNTSTPDNIVKDGACSELHNLRYTGDAWRNVAPFRLELSIANPAGYKIIYKHPEAPANRFIALSGNTLVDVTYGSAAPYSWSVVKELMTLNLDDYAIHHFGNLLIVRSEDTLNNFYLINSSYQLYIQPKAPVVSLDVQRATKKFTFAHVVVYRDGVAYYDILRYSDIDERYFVNKTYSVLMQRRTGDVYLKVNDGGKYWNGEIALFAAYKMKDGTTVCPSMLQIAIAEEDDNGVNRLDLEYLALYNDMLSPDNYGVVLVHYRILEAEGPSSNIPRAALFHDILPVVTLSIPMGDINTDIIDRVSVFATRINPIYDFEALANGKINDFPLNTPTDFLPAYKLDNNLANQPFYLVKDISIDSLSIDNNVGTHTLELSYDIMKHIEQNSLYAPNQSMHELSARVLFDFNSRLHMGDITTRFFDGYNVTTYMETGPDITTNYKNVYNTIGLDPEDRKVGFYMVLPMPNRFLPGVKILSYPDYRAKEFSVYASLRPNGRRCEDKKAYKPAVANNFAYYTHAARARLKYPDLGLFSSGITGNVSIPSFNNIFEEHNRVQVSGINNPFSLPFANSYKVDNPGAIIKTLCSITAQLSESRFGDFPLYIFTDQGIWTLNHGSGEVVYSSLVPVNADRLLYDGVLPAQQFVFYITAMGIMAIQGRQSVLVSEAINDRANQMIAYLKSPKLAFYYQHLHNEVVVYNPDYPYAYIFNLEHRYWSTRDMPDCKLNTDLIYSHSEQVLRNFEYEQFDVTGAGLPIHIATRPIKLGSLEFKRIETLIARLFLSPGGGGAIALEGSNDGDQWVGLRKENLTIGKEKTIRRTKMSFKFFRITLSAIVMDYANFTSFAIEFYNRFLHRMR